MVGAPASPRTYDKRGHEPSKKEKAHTQAMPSLKKRWDAKNEIPKPHVSFTLQELNEYQSV